MRVLGIETSCDETAAAVVEDGQILLSNVVATPTEMHERFGGVVPETAARAHLLTLIPVVERALQQANSGWEDLDALAVTRGPGLAPALLVGLNTAKGIAFARDLPLVGVNHLEGHVYANWIRSADTPNGQRTALESSEPIFPLVSLIVSGGHSDLVLMQGSLAYRRLGRTRDDAAGEAFDKVARMLGLGFPGGPFIQKSAAASLNPDRFQFPRAWLRDTYDFSFSGLKTAVMRELAKFPPDQIPASDIAAGFQESIVDVLVTKTFQAVKEFDARQIALAGGVAANARLRERLLAESPVPVLIPPIWLCTDNAAMIASAGYYRFEAGDRADLALDILATWPIA